MIVGLHSDLCSEERSAGDSRAPAAEREEVLRAFLDYAFQKPEFRMVSIRELLSWLKHPVPHSEICKHSPKAAEALLHDK